MTGQTTIYDVARDSGFSIKTISRVINGAPNVREETVRRVRESIARLDYHPNPAAQRLGGGRLPTIGAVVDSIDDPFFAGVVAVIESRAMDVGMDVLVASTGMDESRMRTQVERLTRRGVAGLVVAPFGGDDTVRKALAVDVPVVVIDRKCGVEDRDVVRATDEQGAYDAVHHLVAHGHRRIAFLGNTSRFTTLVDRYTGYERALGEAGVDIDPRLVETRAWTADEAYPHALALLATADAPTAVFAASPMMGLGVLRAQQRLHRQDIALVIFGDHPASDLMTPPTTFVDQHPSRLANTAFDLLTRRIQEPEAPVRDTVLPTSLVPRGSGELAPRAAAAVAP
ncbi:LacI family DNA-binding transcriptional regulator [Phycicoccus flavus]|uniref:LacI family transcriptional regulator n=1 Tax=Phycicoccus flavus TaxID=2502783 RepID=A0A8T6R6B6_9MICO|nr:LacI family DNA-binding transcriptional regulator [Phycicoccus flavus]NHA69113.1 LacI family transcriptional regulator [Phycicoccus flavus]